MAALPAVTEFHIGEIVLTRVPYVDAPVPHEVLSLEGRDDELDGLSWRDPWMGDGQPLVGLAFWIVRSGGVTIAVDPVGAADGFIRTGPDAVGHQEAAFAALASAGVGAADVDVVVLTHLDGIGMAALADGGAAGEERWRPAFPEANVIVSEIERRTIAAEPDIPGRRAFEALDRAGHVTPVTGLHEPAPGVALVPTAGHGPGHCVVELSSGGERAVMLGHLALSPLHAALGVVDQAHLDAHTAWRALEVELDRSATDGTLLTASLWPTPGAARVVATDPYVLEPAS